MIESLGTWSTERAVSPRFRAVRPRRAGARRESAAVGILLVLFTGACTGAPSPPSRVTIEGRSAVSFPATVDTAGFGETGDPVGYHLIVWTGGRAADGALFRAGVSDVDVLDALEALGADPGNALGIDSWDERHDPDSPAPDRVIAGPPVQVLVRLPDGRELGLHEVLEDTGGLGFAMRFGGHRENIEKWHSGCVVCLYSCPGSKIGNARYTVRDYVQGTTRFRPRSGVLPPDGSEVRIVLRLAGAVVFTTPQ